MPNLEELCGWVPDDDRVGDLVAENGTVAMAAPHLAASRKEDTFLWQPLLQLKPTWRRGSQGIGDCVSWGAELCATMAMAIQHVQGDGLFVAEAATEAIYGGCRVEALGKKTGGWSDGAFGGSAAKWLRDWGVILRKDYTKLDGNPEHDLRQYDKKKAKDWGNFGCGGQNDNAVLDGAARLMAIQQVTQVNTIEEAWAAIVNGYTISIASMAGFSGGKRDNRGICRRSGRWAHQMMIGGVRFRAGAPEFRIFNSWGTSVSGPDPGIDSQAVSDCSWWATTEDTEWILRSGDCWCFADVAGMPPRTVKFARAAEAWYHGDHPHKKFSIYE